MKILFDFYTPQHFLGGAGEYVRKVFYALLEKKTQLQLDVELVGLVDSSLGTFAYDDLTPARLDEKGVRTIDIKGTTLRQIVSDYNIDKVFIGVAQHWGEHFDVESLKCPVVCVVHDLVNEEFATSHIDACLQLDSLWTYLRFRLKGFMHRLKHRNDGENRMLPIMRMAQSNKDVQLVTVSQFSKCSLGYHFDFPQQRIEVLFSPQRVSTSTAPVENVTLQRLIDSGKKYFLMLSANRIAKNAKKALRAYQRYHATEQGNDTLFVTVGYPRSEFDGHVVLPFLKESELVAAMTHCYALIFPSVFEGFGYPPVEAMSYGKPVLAANVTSIPEVLGDAAIYFSPFYESDIFQAFSTLTDANYDHYSSLSRQRSAEVSVRQSDDLERLLQLILK